MTLKTKVVQIQPAYNEKYDQDGKIVSRKEIPNRDVGKKFLVTEMPVLQADNWANRVIGHMAKGGINVRELDLDGGLNTSSMGGMLQLANLGIQGFGNISPHIAQSLLDELIYKTIQFIPRGGEPRTLDIENANDVQEISTLWALRKEAFTLHVSFFTQDES